MFEGPQVRDELAFERALWVQLQALHDRDVLLQHPYDSFATGSEPIFLAVGNDRQFGILCRHLGAPGLAARPRPAALAVALVARLNNASLAAPVVTAPNPGLERVSDVPIYSTDAVVRRAASLQRTADARPPVVGVPSALWQQLRLQAGDKVCVMQGTATVVLPAREDAALANGCVRVPAGHPDTAGLGAMFGPISVEKLVRP